MFGQSLDGRGDLRTLFALLNGQVWVNTIGRAATSIIASSETRSSFFLPRVSRLHWVSTIR